MTRPGTSVLVLLALCTIGRVALWSDDASLWRDASGKSPLSARAHNNLGFALDAVENRDGAEREYLIALDLRPGYPDALNNLGSLRQKQGRYREAAGLFQRALETSVRTPDVLYNLSLSYDSLGRVDEALSLLRRAVALAPCHIPAHRKMASILTRRGERQRAEREYEFIRSCGDHDRRS